MAYGGIAGLDGRKRYGLGSIYQKYIKDPIEMFITGKTPAQLEGESQARVERETELYGPDYQNPIDTWLKGPATDTAQDLTSQYLGQNLSPQEVWDAFTGGVDWLGERIPAGLKPYMPVRTKIQTPDPDDPSKMIEKIIEEQKVNPAYPIAGGMIAHEYAKRHPGDPGPVDTTGIDFSRFATAEAAKADPN